MKIRYFVKIIRKNYAMFWGAETVIRLMNWINLYFKILVLTSYKNKKGSCNKEPFYYKSSSKVASF